MYEEISLYDDNGQFYAITGRNNKKVLGKGNTPYEALLDWATKNEDIDVPEAYLD